MDSFPFVSSTPSVASLLVPPVSGGQFAGAVLTVVTTPLPCGGVGGGSVGVLGSSSFTLLADTCIQHTFPFCSHISSSTAGRVFRKARYSLPFSTDGRCMSAASPRRCREFFTPPTARFSSGQRYPLVMRMGPNLSRKGWSTMWHRYARLSTCSTLEHSFSMPSLLAVSERVTRSDGSYLIVAFYTNSFCEPNFFL